MKQSLIIEIRLKCKIHFLCFTKIHFNYLILFSFISVFYFWDYSIKLSPLTFINELQELGFQYVNSLKLIPNKKWFNYFDWENHMTILYLYWIISCGFHPHGFSIDYKSKTVYVNLSHSFKHKKSYQHGIESHTNYL